MPWNISNQAALQAAEINAPEATQIYNNQYTTREGIVFNTFMVFVETENTLTLQFHSQTNGAWLSREAMYQRALGNERQMQESMNQITRFLNEREPRVPNPFGLLPIITHIIRGEPQAAPAVPAPLRFAFPLGNGDNPDENLGQLLARFRNGGAG